MPRTPALTLGRSTIATNHVQADLRLLETAVTVLENQWHRFRDDPTRLSPYPEEWEDYLRRLFQWYTVELPRDKQALLKRITEYWDTDVGKEWKRLCSKLETKTERNLRIVEKLWPQIDHCNALWDSLHIRCRVACEEWSDLRQLEVPWNSNVRFVLPGPRALGLLPVPELEWE